MKAASKSQGIYLDYQASTPVDPRVKDAMAPYFEKFFANPHSNSHDSGIEAWSSVDFARRQIANSVNIDARSVFFTSGATEANNLAILGVAEAAGQNRRKIVTIATEHSSVIGPIEHLKARNFDIDILPVLPSGLVDMELLESSLGESTLLVSIMHVNNETGVIQPIDEIAKICHKAGVLFHSDCAQSLGKTRIDLGSIDLDFATMSSHKSYGPKGVGALYVKRDSLRYIQPIIFGGGQEQSLRPGTLPVPLCVGFGKACELAVSNYEEDHSRISKLSNLLIKEIQVVFPEASLNGSPEKRAAGSFSICFPGCHSEELLDAFEGIEVSTGSACASTEIEPSRVLRAYGLSNEDADSSLRFGIGRFTTPREVLEAIDIIVSGLNKLGVADSNKLNDVRLRRSEYV